MCAHYFDFIAGDSFPLTKGCVGTQYGCCQDGKTAALGPNYGGCPGIKTIKLKCIIIFYWNIYFTCKL